MKIIIVGCGKMGYTIAKDLSVKKGIDVTIADNNPNIFNDSAELIDAMFITGNGASEKTLIEAGAKNADLIVSTTNTDELNILCCIMAERLGTKHSIARVRNPAYMLEFNKLWKDLGIDRIINPERQTAREISRLLRYPSADDIDTFAEGRVEMVSFKISETPKYFIGKSVSQVFKGKMEVLLSIVERENKAFIPHGDFIFEESDVIRILGRPSNIMKFFAHIHQKPRTQEVMVIGGGKISYYLTELLSRHTIKTNIKIIEIDRGKCETLSETLSAINRRCMIIHGDGTNEEILIAEEIGNTDALVCLTDRDEENAIISFYALRMGVKKVITKINHTRQNMMNNLGLELRNMITPQRITAKIVAKYVEGLTDVIGSNIKTIHRIFSDDDGTVEAIEFLVKQRTKSIGVPIKDLKLKKGILIGCISRDSEIIIPSGEAQIQLGDNVIIITKGNDIRELDDILANKTKAFADTAETEEG